MIYLDSAATTLRKPEAVYQGVLRTMRRCSGVGRGGHEAAMRAAEVVHACRVEAGRLFDAEPEQVVFTMNATHGLNVAIRSLCRSGMSVAISGYEHNAVTRPLYAMGARLMIAGRELFRPEHAIEQFKLALDRGAELVVCTCCSNVFGYLLPVQEIGALCRKRKVPFILDASQAAGSLPVSLRNSGAAFIAMPGHKGLYGPQGTGILLCGSVGEPLLYGGTGGQSAQQQMPSVLPDRLEAGTHNVCGIGGLLEGLRYVRRRGVQRIRQKEQQLLTVLCRELSAMEKIQLFRGPEQSGVLSLRVKGRDCEEVAQVLAEQGVACRAGLHCAPLAHESAGTAPGGTVRLSVSDGNTEQEIRQFLRICKKIL